MTDDELRGFARAAHRFLDWVYAQSRDDADGPVVTLLTGHLGDRLGQPVVARTLPAFQHVNVQVALDAYAGAPGRDVAVHGLAAPLDMPPLGLHQMLYGGMPPVRLTAPDLVDLPSGPGGRTLACLRAGLLLVTDARGPYALAVRGPAERYGEPEVTVEVAGLPPAAAQEVLAEVVQVRGVGASQLDPQVPPYRGPQRLPGPGPSLREVLVDSPYEGWLDVFVGITERRGFRVFRLQDPTRVVVDVQHP